ncbi:MAG TPA: hypothetical protein VGN07_07925 [Steroidobacteraceae bacterium]|jgi:hypothetical protein
MKKNEFLQDPQTASFIEWLVSKIDGDEALAFAYQNGVDHDLGDSLARYEWPPKSVRVDTPNGVLSLAAQSSFAANSVVLETLSAGMRTTLNAPTVNDEELIHWARAIMKWGGVLTRKPNGKGNVGWLESMGATSFSEYLLRALAALNEHDDAAPRRLNDLRSNAGTTKVHSLLLPDFVIYDSRVAAALAWLVQSWGRAEAVEVPGHLRFACMPANTTKQGGKLRSPDSTVFSNFSPSGDVRNHHRHATWNLRANWVIRSAIDRLQDRSEWSPRKVEAALFMMGDDLTWAAEVGGARRSTASMPAMN